MRFVNDVNPVVPKARPMRTRILATALAATLLLGIVATALLAAAPRH
jgi:hypothetical protein